MMADLIDRDALMQYPIRIDHYDKKNGNIDFMFGIESVIEFAEALPTVDAVEVVRCKNCVHYQPVDGGRPLCEYHERATFADDFCSYGERSARRDGRA